MEKYINIIKQYLNYILSTIIVLLIIIIGFLYSNKTTVKIEKEKKEPKIEEEVKIVEDIYIDIKGEVKKPGVYSFKKNERVIDAINKSGGLTNDANTDYLNLSKKLTDEMVIIIYSKKEIKEFEKKKNEVKEIIKYEVIESDKKCPNITNNACMNDVEKNELVESSNTLINLNTASKEELLTLTGIGESKADAIKNIKGIGDSLYEKIKDSITV